MIRHIKSLSLLIVMLTSTVAHAQQTTNAIYIEQVGDSSDISVTQIGDGNKVGQIDNRFDMIGDNQWINIYQQGPRNILTGRVVGDNIWAHIAQSGFDNLASVNIGQVGDSSDSYFDLHVYGDGNVTNFTQGAVSSAIGVETSYHITGALNTVTSTIETNDAVNQAYINGNFNTVTTNQTGFGGKNSNMTIDGNNNNIQVNQTSTLNVDSLLLNTVGSGSSITITQCTAGQC